MAGSWYDHYGAAVDPLCLPPNPQYLKSQSGYQSYALLYGAEYQLHTSSPINHVTDRNIPCALCQAYGCTNKIIIPSHYECPPGWNTEYYSYLMAGYHGNKAATQFNCVDKSLEQIPGSGSNTNGKLFFTVEAQCNYFIPCSDKEKHCHWTHGYSTNIHYMSIHIHNTLKFVYKHCIWYSTNQCSVVFCIFINHFVLTELHTYHKIDDRARETACMTYCMYAYYNV